MASGTRQGTLYVIKKDCTGRNREKISSARSKLGDEIHVLKGSLFEHGTDRSSNPKKITLHSCENNQIVVNCSVNDVEEISPEESKLLLGITTCQDRLKVLEDKNWLAEGLHIQSNDLVWVIKQKGIPEKTDAIVRYKGHLPSQAGIQFGLELLSSRGYGTTDGVFRQKQYFSCDENCGLFIPLNKIRLAKAASSPRQKAVSNGLPQKLYVSDRIVWYSDTGPEHGTVKWIGILPDSQDKTEIAGVEFDNPIGTGNGKYRDKQLFKAKYKHASLVPIFGLIREDDFYQSCNEMGGYANGTNGMVTSSSISGLPGAEKATRKIHQNHVSENSEIIQNQRRILAEQQVNGTRSRRNPDNGKTFGMNGASPQKENDFDKVHPSDRFAIQVDGHGGEFVADSMRRGAIPKKDARAGISDQKLAAGYTALTGRQTTERYIHDGRSDPAPPPTSRTYMDSGVSYPAPSSAPSSWDNEPDVEVGDMAEVNYKPKRYGVVRWIGCLKNSKDSTKRICGLEMEEEHPSYNDGTFGDMRYFECPLNKGLFVYLSKVRRDQRFMENPKYLERTNSLAFGSMLCEEVKGNLYPMSTFSDVKQLCGKHKGIQGHHNSCYLDSTLFTMFAFTDVFDSILYREPREGEISIYESVQNILKNSIVNPLRQNYFVRADKVVELRRFLDKVGSVKGMMTEEKDPEEFLTLLLEKVMRADPFIRLSSGQESYFYQLFIEKDERLQLPTIQQLLELSFMESDIKLNEIPKCLILQMPRFGKDYKMYQRIFPSLKLDITDVLECGTRECTICGDLALWECKQCYKEWGESLSKIAYCNDCNQRSHGNVKRSDHKPKKLAIPEEFRMRFDKKQEVPREVMELIGVICIQTSHYVSFVKCGRGEDAPWVFFDSMADRMGEANGYNIPEVRPVPLFTEWLSERNKAHLAHIRDDKDIQDPLMRRLLCDAYVCLYQSVEASKYG